MQSSISNEQEKAFTSRLFFGPEKLLRVLEEKDLGVVISDKLYLRLTFTPDYSKSKQTSRSAKKVLLFSDFEAPPLLRV